ncbi:hypothetical protein E2C01_088377 [Portunus trituberculatus]|uniref:Uncharacterized protein n=1 Tax=Portunus trituberculatus TaxID=210409 RepID=A0A5B7JFT7_PORTR|nr:hypothetical protein [Portunus trituberculatus]
MSGTWQQKSGTVYQCTGVFFPLRAQDGQRGVCGAERDGAGRVSHGAAAGWLPCRAGRGAGSCSSSRLACYVA